MLSANDKVLVTGAGGFIGSHLVELLLDKGLIVKAFVRYNSRSNCGWLQDIENKQKLEIEHGDIRDFDSVFNAMVGCDAVFHLAALIGIPYSYVSPMAYIKTNIEGTFNVLEAARHHNLKQVLITSTSETYGTAQYTPIDENHPLVGQSPYSASKIAADQLAISYYRSFKLPVKIIRPFNTYGPRQSARAIIPTIIIQLLKGSSEVVIGSITPTRDFTYVKDTVNAFWEIAKSTELFGEITNIGISKEISIGDLFSLLNKKIGTKLTISTTKTRVRPENSEVERLLCNNAKIKEKTSWLPKYSLGDGLNETIEWFNNHLSLYEINKYHI